MAQTIYFDESGFTGDNLLNGQQAYFSYASVASDDNEAKSFVEHIVGKYRIQGNELKGSTLVNFNAGRKAVDEIFERFEGRMKISISDKKFALACKFFEYIFEPAISANNALFYQIGFHRFIANMLYLEFKARGAGADEIFAEFESLMRSKNEVKLISLFSSSVHPKNSPWLTQIREFAQTRADDIRDELDRLGGTGKIKWILDLSKSALFSLLADWGQEHDIITAICDPSKPLQADTSIFDTMIGRTDRLFSDAFGDRHPITFNLSGPLQFEDSKIKHGIQIADVIAAASVYAFSRQDEQATRWRHAIAKVAAHGSVLPDFDEIKLEDLSVQRNAVVLLELHQRAKAGEDLLDGMPAFVRFVEHRLEQKPIARRTIR